MKLRNKSTGREEFMHYDPAAAAVEAGTHEFVNDEGEPHPGSEAAIQQGTEAAASVTPAAIRTAPEGSDGQQEGLKASQTSGDAAAGDNAETNSDAAAGSEGEKVDPVKHSKEDLLAIAKDRNVEVPEGATKVQIADAINAA